MYQSLELFQTSAAMARHAGERQSVVARNIANADTPGYRAQQIASFDDTYTGLAPLPLRHTRPGHINAGAPIATLARITDTGSEASPNGNTVSLEDELLASVAVAREHNRALTIYRHGMTVLRTALGRG